MRQKLFAIVLFALCAACSAPQPTVAPIALSTPTRALVATLAPTSISVRERFTLRDLPGVGRRPMAVGVLDGKVYAANSESDNVAVVQDNRVVKFIPVGKNPSALAVDPTQKRIYVSTVTDKTISIISNDQVATKQVLSDDVRTLLFFENRLFAGAGGKGAIWVLDPATLQTQAIITIPNAFTVVNLAGDVMHRRVYANVFEKTVLIDSTNLKLGPTISVKGSYFTLAAHPPSDAVLIAAYETDSQTQFLGAYDAGAGTLRGRIPVGGDPRGATINADGSRAYIANSFGRSVSVVDPRTLSAIATIPVGLEPNALALDESARRLYVANAESDSVTAINTETNQVAATIPLGMIPTALAANESTGRVYIANASSDSVFVVEGTRVAREIPVGRHPIDLAYDPGLHRVLVANEADTTISIVDEADFSVHASPPITRPLTVALDGKGRVFTGDAILDAGTLALTARLMLRGVTVGFYVTPTFVRVNPNNNRIYAFGGNGVPGSGGRIVTYSVDGNTLQQRTPLPGNGNSNFIAIDPQTNRVYLAETQPLAMTAHLTAFDADDNRLISIPLPARASGLVYNPETHHLFVAHASSSTRTGSAPPLENAIQVFDVTTFGELARLAVNSPGKMTRLGNTIYIAGDDGFVTLIQDAVLPAPPAPTATFTPTPFPSLTPAPATPTPSAPRLPSATPRVSASCATQVGALFQFKWVGEVLSRLGCPSENAHVVNFAMQVFEHGRMFYRDDEKKIYAIADDKSWVALDDRWTNALPEESCPSIAVAAGKIKPKRGFGKVWCEDAGLRAKLGAATIAEEGPLSMTVQRAERGLMFGIGGVAWALVDGGKWE